MYRKDNFEGLCRSSTEKYGGKTEFDIVSKEYLEDNNDLSSVSSTADSSSSFSGIVRDFKKSLSDRRMPKSLIILNRLIILILLIAIVL